MSETRRNGKKATPPCPCGWLGHFSARCRCTPDQVLRYRSRISGPLIDRIDLHVEVPALRDHDLAGAAFGEHSASVRARVEAARARQLERQGVPNALLSGAEAERECASDAAAQGLLREATSRLALSARAFHRVLKLARTIADLGGRPVVEAAEVAEALAYRGAQR
ncbi:MAG: ATP-binding protein [Phycisphaeraceae bacterium]|nr:ATP-binding protein [Phycisphaeraceae bacterium]